MRLHYEGSEAHLSIAFNSREKMIKEFEHKFKQQYGYLLSATQLAIDSVVVEVTGGLPQPEIEFANVDIKCPDKISLVNLFVAGSERKAKLYQREWLKPAETIPGPVIIIEPNNTIVVQPGWQITMQAQGELILHRAKPLAKQVALGTQVDPVQLEVFNNLFMSIAEQMGAALKRTAFSVNIKERLDFSCAIFDTQGDLVANAPHIPVHLGSMSESVKTIIQLRQGKMQPGDAYMLNDPYHGGTHLPDVTVMTPVFHENCQTPLFYVGSRAHQADIGGVSPGSMPAFSQCIEQEGVLINNFTLVEQGELQQQALIKLLTEAKYSVRNLEQSLADIQAQLAANHKGVQELLKMVAHYGVQVVQVYMQHIQDNATACVQTVLDRLHDGHFSYTLDNGACITVSLSIDKAKREACVDFTGTSVTQNNNFNAPRAVVYAAVLYVFRTLVAEKIPLNQGCLKPLKIIIPQGTMNNLTFGNDQYQYYETICGGAGAGNGFDGASAVHTHMTNSLLTDPEILEQYYPVLLQQFAVRHGSGGHGKWSGGDDVIRRMQFRQDLSCAMISNRRVIAPFGLQGGEPGLPGLNFIERADGHIEALNSVFAVSMAKDDILHIETPGGGGYGI